MRKPRSNRYRLQMPAGSPPTETVRAFALDCLVPLLAEEFLRLQQSAQPHTAVIPKKPTTGLHGKEDGR